MHPPGDLASNPGMCPRLGIEAATLWFSGWCSIRWATPARVPFLFLNCHLPCTVAGTQQVHNVYQTKITSTLYHYFNHSTLLHSTKPCACTLSRTLLRLAILEMTSNPCLLEYNCSAALASPKQQNQTSKTHMVQVKISRIMGYKQSLRPFPASHASPSLWPQSPLSVHRVFECSVLLYTL